MLHDQSMSRSCQNTGLDNRRTESRTKTDREVLIAWHHAPDQGARYGVVDESQGGCLITSTVPLIEGMTGTVLGRIPAKGHRHSAIVVAWSRPVDGTWHVGLRYLS
jgi:hypothetical protein